MRCPKHPPNPAPNQVSYTAPAPGHTDRVVMFTRQTGLPQSHGTCLVRRDADSVQQRALRMAKVASAQKPYHQRQQRHKQDADERVLLKQTPTTQTCNIVPQPKGCLQVQNIEDAFAEVGKVDLPQPPSSKSSPIDETWQKAAEIVPKPVVVDSKVQA